MKNISFIKFIFAAVFMITALVLIEACSKKEDENKIPVTTSSEEASADFLKGRALFEKLRGQESLTFFESALEKDEDFALAYYYHSLSSPSAKGFFADLGKMVPLADKVSEGEKLIIFGLKAGVDGDQKTQEEHLTKLVELYPDDERAHNQLGQFYFGQQKFQLAVDHLKKATEIAPDFSLSYNTLGYSYRNLGKFDNAAESFVKYIELIPDDPNPYDSYAELLLKEGKYEESITQYQKALSVKPDFVASYVGIATNYNFLAKYEDAREQCGKLFDIAKNTGEKRIALFAKVVSFVTEENTEMALEELQNQYAIAEEINDPAAMTGDLNTMGNILFEAGRYDEAIEKHNKALETTLNSDLPDEVKENTKRFYLFNLGRISLMTGNMEDARSKAKEFGESASMANNTFQVWLSHELNGMIALAEKQYGRARGEFMLANQQNPYTFYRIALTYEGEENEEEAKRFCEMSINFNALNNLNQAFVLKKAEKMLASM
jgi:tetratricopeptide (TPR) repeat protein